MDELVIIITAAVSLALTASLMPWFIRKMHEKGLVAQDRHKRGMTLVANNGGLLVLFVVMVAVILMPLVFRFINRILGQELLLRDPTDLDNAVLLVLLLYAFYGVLDDYINVGRASKAILPLLFSYPLVIVLAGWDPWIPGMGTITTGMYSIALPFGGVLTGSMFLKYVIAPVYIMVVAHLKNMHSGFNGLQTGTALLVLATLVLKSGIQGDAGSMLTASAVLGAVLGFFWFNRYPSRIFEGNIGSLAIGGTIGAIIVIQHYLWAGFVMLLPHTLNFLLYLYWRLRHWLSPDDPRYRLAKYAQVREDGTIEPPNPYTLKWLLPCKLRMTEREATLVMYLLTALFCALGFFVPG
ncbi:MAG: UDP-N-acetylglucosamine-1-phosphate transferase [Candidatus Thermoplasmatota archaeon]